MRNAVVVLAVTALFAAPALGQDAVPSLGRLQIDRGFGTGGAVRIRAGRESMEYPQFLEVDPAGRVVVAGTALALGKRGSDFERHAVLIARFLPDGTLDADFGGDGIVTLPVVLGNEWLPGFAIDRLARITVIGGLVPPKPYYQPSDPSYVAARLNDDGSLDASFSEDGLLESTETQWAGGGAIRMNRIDGSFVTESGVGSPGDRRWGMVRLKPDGSLDPEFHDAEGIPGRALDFAIDASGGVVVIVREWPPVIPTADQVIRLRPDGTRDPDFGTLGVLRGAGSSVVRGEAVEIDGTGRIVVMGFEDRLARALYRYTADGQPDLSFGENGRAPLALGTPGDAHTFELRLAVARDTDEYLVSSGSWYLRRGFAQGTGFFLRRFDPDTPAFVRSFHRRFPRRTGDFPRTDFDASAISHDGKAAFVVHHTARTRNDLTSTLVRIDLTRASPRPVPDLSIEFLDAPLLDRSAATVRATLLVRNTGRAAVTHAVIDLYGSLDIRLDARDTLIRRVTTGAVPAGAEPVKLAIELPIDPQGVLTTDRLVAFLNPFGEMVELSTEDDIAVSALVEEAAPALAR